MMEHQRRIERIRSVEREYKAGSAAASLLTERLAADPSWGLREGWKSGDAQDFRRNPGPTFVIRLFAEFEAGLRDYWAKARSRKSKPPMKDLLDAISSERRISSALLDQVHQVRELRNSYVHDREVPAIDLSVAEVRRRVCTFLARLPRGS